MSELTDLGLVAATIVVAFATAVLATFTWLLWRTNKQLAKVEERRAAIEARRRRYMRIAWKVELAERILKEDRARFLPTVDKASGGGWYRAELNSTPTGAPWLRHFARLVDPQDGISASTLTALLEVLDAMNHEGTSIDEDNMERKFFTPLQVLRDGIYNRPEGGGDNLLTKWRAEMDKLAAGEEVPPPIK
jgi:hypothetical protein